MSYFTRTGTERWVGRLVAPLVIAGAIGTLVLGSAWMLLSQRHIIARSTDDANLAAIVGPPCPAVSATAFRSALKSEDLTLKYVFDFNGDTFGRAIGDGDCDVAAAQGAGGLGSYDVCEFTGPAVLYVKSGRGEFFFLPGVGHKATVTTAGGVARCVLAAPKLDY
jgi:hypothetical protein